MKDLLHLFAFILLAGILFSCSPKVVTTVLKSYPVLPESEIVAVYEREKDDPVPAKSETVGNIAVVDNLFVIRASYEQVVNLAVDETRKNGGNALLITDHLKPSFWGSTIHQIAGLMLNVDKMDTTFVSSKKTYVSIQEDYERKRIRIPSHTFILNSGYSSLVGRTEGLSSEEKKIIDKLHQGITWDFQYYYHHKGLPYGWGIMLSQFYSSPFDEVVYRSQKNNIRLDYAGLSLGLRTSFSSKWMGSLYYGFGYLGVMQKFSNPSNPTEFGNFTGSTLGIHFGAAIEYKISERVGLGIDFSNIIGSLSSVKYYNLILDPSSPEISSDNRLNASRLNASIGLRYYLK